MTVAGVWKNDDRYPQFNLQISEEKLNAWPEKGDITELDEVDTVFEVDNDGNEQFLENENNPYTKKKANAVSDKLNRDGNDLGPAPLQNTLAPLETFEGVMEMNSKNKGGCARAQ